MGLFSWAWKGIKKGFKAVGKFIQKSLKKLGKFVNSLGIVGQLGMAVMLPALSRAMAGGLTSMGSGWMSGLAAAAKKGSGLAKVTHALLQGSLDAVSMVSSGFGTITETVVGSVLDTGRAIGTNFGMDPVAAIDGSVIGSNSMDQMFNNVVERLDTGVEKTLGIGAGALERTGDLFTDIMPKGEGRFFGEGAYAPNYQTFTVDGEVVEGDIRYNRRNQELYKNSPEGATAKKEYLKTPEGAKAKKEYLKTPEGEQAVRKLRADTPGGSDMDILFDPNSVSDEMIKSYATQQADIDIPTDWMDSYIPESETQEEEYSLLGSFGEGFKKEYKNPLTVEALSTQAAAQVAAYAMAQLDDEEPTPTGGSGGGVAADTDEIYLETVGAVGSGQALGSVTEFGAGVDLSSHPDSIAARNLLGGPKFYDFLDYAKSSQIGQKDPFSLAYPRA